jgi:hypothetical protein
MVSGFLNRVSFIDNRHYKSLYVLPIVRFTSPAAIRRGRIRVNMKYVIRFKNPGIIKVFFPSFFIAKEATLPGSITEGLMKPYCGFVPRYPGVAVAPAQQALTSI